MKRLAGAAALLLCTAMQNLTHANEALKALYEEKGEAVVVLEVVTDLKYTFQGQQFDQERKLESPGVIVDSDGLLVTALSNIDPSKQSEAFMGADAEMSVTVKSVTYIMDDNSEVEARVVLRDPDLDLAFIRPLDKPEETLTHISLADSGDAEVFDELYALDRAGRIARRTLLGRSGTLSGLIERPRKIYLPSGGVVTRNIGTPVFTSEGKLLGITATYTFPGGAAALGDSDQPYINVIIPAEDVAEVAEQAPAPEE